MLRGLAVTVTAAALAFAADVAFAVAFAVAVETCAEGQIAVAAALAAENPSAPEVPSVAVDVSAVFVDCPQVWQPPLPLRPRRP